MKKLIFITLLISLIAACTGSTQPKSEEKQDAKEEVKSVQEISKEIEKNPTDAELYYRRAGIYYNEKYLDLALADVEQALVLKPDNSIYLFRKGRILYALNKTIEAAKIYEQTIAINPDFLEARLELAELYFLVKEHKKANDQFNIILAKDNKNTEALFLKGMNYKDMGDTASAVQAFQKTYELDANHYDAVMQLGLLYAAAKNKAALDYYITASRLNPKSAEPPYNAGVFLQLSGDLKKAIKMYQQALKADPSHYLAYYNAGIINFDVKQYEDAIANFDAVVRINAGYADAYYMRGYCYEKLKKREDARINYEYALEINPAYTFAKEGLARVK